LVRYDARKIARAVKKSELKSRPSTLWRYQEFLSLRAERNRVSLGEGFTPLIEARHLAAELSIKRLWIKDEAQNPTGSFKDRGLSVAISLAKELGIKKVAIPSAGNAGGSLSPPMPPVPGWRPMSSCPEILPEPIKSRRPDTGPG